MSWLARSLTSSFNYDEGDDDGDDADQQKESPRSRGVKEDLSELTKSFTRQLWGVASFLAPPPPTSSITDSPSFPSPSSAAAQNSSSAVPDSPSSIKEAMGGGESDPIAGDSPRTAGIRSDLSEIGGRFKSGISMLSGNKAVSEISRLASSFLPFGSVEEEESEEVEDDLGASPIGVTEEVLTFARNISMHPETWLDFPLFADDEHADDFEMSDAQRDHALAVEHLAPRLAALRIELCPRHMSEGCFWKIYFVLLHSRLSKHDAELLSTPQIVQARGMLQEIQSRTRTGSNTLESSSYVEEVGAKLLSQEPHNSKSEFELSSSKYASSEPAKSLGVGSESERLSTADELKIVDKSVIDEQSFTLNKDVLTQTVPVSNEKFEEDGDDWLQDSAEISGAGQVTPAFVNEEDVSFSDLEDDGDNSCFAASSKGNVASDSSVDGSRGWVQLGESHSDDAIEDTGSSRPSDIKSLSSKDRRDGDPPRRTRGSRESNDWLSIDDIDAV